MNNSILHLNHRIKNEKANCRGGSSGDVGKMFSLGKKTEKEEYSLSKNNTDIQCLMSTIGILRKEWFIKEFPVDYDKKFQWKLLLII